MRKGLPITIILVVSAAALFYVWLADEDDKTSAEADADQSAEEIQISRDDSASVLVGSTSVTGRGSQAATGALPGITVIGYGDATAKPDAAIIRITAGAGSGAIGFGSSETFRLELIDEAEVQPVVDALKEKGVAADDINVTTSTGGQFSPFEGGAVQITFRWGNPEDLRSVLDLAENTLRQKTQHELQNVEVLYTITDCEPLEDKAVETALQNARQRAERLAELSGAELGGITAIAESPAASIYGFPVQSGCDAVQELPPLDFGSAPSSNSASELEVDATLQVTFAIK